MDSHDFIDGETFEQRRQRLIEEYRLAELPIIQELNSLGVTVAHVYDLGVGKHITKPLFMTALPVLLKWLPLVSHAGMKDTIVRVLGVRWSAPSALLPLITAFRTWAGTSDSVMWAIGDSLSRIANDTVFEEVVALACDKQYGKSREMLTLALARMRNPLAVDILIELLQDDEVAGHAVMALGKLRNHRAAKAIEPFTRHSKTWIRREAKKALIRVGVTADASPRQIHLVNGHVSIPKDLLDTSTSVGIENLGPLLEACSTGIESGFGGSEIAEVTGVAELMDQGEVHLFCFPISTQGRKSDLWLKIMADDGSTANIAFHGHLKAVEMIASRLARWLEGSE